jgi:hypothetical protein
MPQPTFAGRNCWSRLKAWPSPAKPGPESRLRPESPYQVQVSAQLMHWTMLDTVTAPSSGIIEILDTGANEHPRRFHRAVLQETTL